MYAPTTHFDGDHATRQTIQALEAKGIVVEVGTAEHGERLMRLTEFGWAVYRQNRRIIHRLTADQIDAAEKKAQATR